MIFSSLFSIICVSWFIFTLSLFSKVGGRTLLFPFPNFYFIHWFEQWINSVESFSLRQSEYLLFMIFYSPHVVLKLRLEFSQLNWIDSVPMSLICPYDSSLLVFANLFNIVELLSLWSWSNRFVFCECSEPYLNFRQWMFTEQWKESGL